MEPIGYMRKAGELAAQTLDYISPYIIEGVTTEELNSLCHNFIIEHDAIPAPLNYKGFPKSICASVNHVVCHGIPGPKKLRNGDIINIDVTVILDGWHGDTSRMFFVGKPSIKAKRLVDATYEAMMAGINQIKPGATTGDIGYAIQECAKKYNFSVVREFCGHGIGQVFHDFPQVPFFGEQGTGVELKSGMFITVEPMINAGKAGTRILKDGWTAITKDRSLGAQWEHTIAVIDGGYEIMTVSNG